MGMGGTEMRTARVIVMPYDRAWKAAFEAIKGEIERAGGNLVIGIEHVGIGTDFDGDGGIIGCASASELINFTRQLLKQRYSEADIRRIWGGNFLRVMEEVQRI